MVNQIVAMVLLDFFNLGGVELAIILAILLAPLGLIIYSIFDILRGTFKNPLMKWLFLLLVICAPFIGSIIYLIMRRDYIKTKPVQGHFH